MNRLSFLFIFFLILLSILPFVSANFACGVVNSSKDFSSSWISVIVYFEENKSDFTECKINPESKFCCDLENISSVEFAVGKKVFAEVFDREKGLVSGPVNLYLTDNGYDLFPDMILEKAVIVNLSNKNIVINKSYIPLKITLDKRYKDIKYSINSSQGYLEGELCTNCSDYEFSPTLFKGKNEILILSGGDRKIFENITIYNLDYFNFEINFSCDKCKKKKRFFYVPSEEEIKVHYYFNASHNISGDFFFYMPSQWDLSSSLKLEDFSFTHRGFREHIINKKEFSVEYTIKIPKTFIKQDYIIYQKLNGYELFTKVRVFKIKLIPFHKINPLDKGYSKETLEQRTSPNEPIVLNSEEDYLKLVAIFPKEEILTSYSNLGFDSKKFGKGKENTFTILTSIPQENIEKILLIFKVEKGKDIHVYNLDNKVPLEFYEEDTDYIYYSAYITEKGPFNVKIF